MITLLPEYPVLYSRDSVGNIRFWRMERERNKHRTVTGIQDGKAVFSEWTEVEPKNINRSNATSAIEQAHKEIEAKYKKQLKTGYFKKIEDIDKEQYFQCMLAKNYEDYKDKIDWSKGVGVQIKYNGGRIIARKEGLFSRKGEKILSVPHIENGLKPFFKKFPKAILDGEGFNYDLREKLNEIMSLLRKTIHITPEDLQKSKELIRFYVYDGGNFNEMKFEHDYLIRKQVIDIYFKTWYGKDIIHKVPTWVVYSEKELQTLFYKFLADNQEGLIVRILGQPYQNKRSKYLLKYKPVDDDEGIIENILEGEGNWSGTGKVIVLKWKDKIIYPTFKGTYEQAVKFLKEKEKWIGKEVTFLYNGLTGLGIPNYPRIDINNCLKK